MQDESEIIRNLEHLRKSMRSNYSDYEQTYKDVQKFIAPHMGRFDKEANTNSDKARRRLIDSTARQAFRTLRSGMMSGVSSPSRPWFRLGLYDEDAADDPEVKDWLHTAQSRMYTVMRGSNLYRALNVAYGSLGAFGVYGGVMRGHFDDVFHVRSFQVGQFLIDDDEDGKVNRMAWTVPMTVRSVTDRFGIDKVSSRVKAMYKAGRHSDRVWVHAAIEQRMARNPASPLAIDMEFGLYYYEDGVTDRLLMNGGLERNGILSPRWDPVDGEAWPANSPGQEALGDAIQLEVQHRDKGMAIQLGYNPSMQGPPGSKRRQLRAIPGRMTEVTTTDIQRGGVRPTHDVSLNINHLSEDIRETQMRVKEAMFEPLFMMASQYGIEGAKNVTATAIAEMHEEKLIALGPVLEALDHSLLSPVVENAFHYMQAAEILPPPPDQIGGQPVKVEFISLLAQAQKAIGVAAIERTIGFVGTLAGMDPSAGDKLDVDAAIDEFADLVGPSPKIIVTTDKANEVRQARQQQIQQQQAVEAAQPLAQATKLISEANERGAVAVEGRAQ